ncbi:serine hydrolase domain-containing protein [Agromyces sp. NPDC058110]|uniref:serine hydrolase domain-containing protein n=1 Tax=Agromyces sp. NPDC058110 TaxID=3346345 RepID=UPI0036DCF4B5
MRKGAKIALGITGGLVALVLMGVGVLAVLNRPLSRDEVDAAIEQRLRAVVDGDATVSRVLLTIASGSDGRLMQYAVGEADAAGEPVAIDSAYHSASVGKSMLAAVYGQLVDEGVLEWESPVATWLDDGTLGGLFVVDGVDHADEVTVGQLLSHISGVADYFEGPVTAGSPMLEQLIADPDRSYTPQDLLAFSRERQVPVGVPGERFSYSDTGYVLLGLALEQIEGEAYERVLERRLFEPLGMADSRFMTEFGAGSDILPITIDGVDFSERNALSVDWAGGGVATTMGDLLVFVRALYGGDLVSPPVLSDLTDFAHEMESGIRYGMGTMQFRFAELSPLLFSMTDLHGAVGATGTFALYDPSSDTAYVANFGSLDFQQKAIEELVQVRLLVDRLQL